jgi:hypothetical protein
VCLPGEHSFNRVRCPAKRCPSIGNIQVARGSSRSPKSGRHSQLYPPSIQLHPLRRSLAANFSCSNLRFLLGEFLRSGRPCVRALRRHPRPSCTQRRRLALPRVPSRTTAVCGSRRIWNLRRPHESRNPHSQI